MSKVNKMKRVRELSNQQLNLPSNGQFIARVIGSKGNNLHQIETEDGKHHLLSMPRRFRNCVWIHRGDYVLAESINEGNRVKGEMICLLTLEHIHYFAKMGAWPEHFKSVLDLVQHAEKENKSSNGSDMELEVKECTIRVRTDLWSSSDEETETADEGGSYSGMEFEWS